MQIDQIEEMSGETGVNIPMMASKNNYRISVSSSRNEEGKLSET